jgi:hypothetical protein
MSKMPEGREEVPLAGGYTNAGLVVRVGNTVRRPQRPTSPAVHAVLDHLERVGFDSAPRFLGIDERNREILTYQDGEAVLSPYPSWSMTDEALMSVARLIRSFHDAMDSFDPSPHHWPDDLPERFRGRMVTHNDPNLDNVLFVDGRAVGLIDFDLASPGSRVWDVACAARLWSPLRDDRDLAQPLRGRALERLRLFVDAYGLSPDDRQLIADAVGAAHGWCYRIVRRAVAGGHDAFERMWREGGQARAQRTQDWLTSHRDAIRDAVS